MTIQRKIFSQKYTNNTGLFQFLVLQTETGTGLPFRFLDLSRRRRFFGGGFLYRVLDFGMSALDFTVPVHAALRICFTPQTLLFLHSIFMSSSSPFFCATLRPRAPPGSGRNLVLHFVTRSRNWSKLGARADFKTLYLSEF